MGMETVYWASPGQKIQHITSSSAAIPLHPSAPIQKALSEVPPVTGMAAPTTSLTVASGPVPNLVMMSAPPLCLEHVLHPLNSAGVICFTPTGTIFRHDVRSSPSLEHILPPLNSASITPTGASFRHPGYFFPFPYASQSCYQDRTWNGTNG